MKVLHSICIIFALSKKHFLMEKLHPIMFAGTGSDVGKSIIAAAFCRIFRQDGYHPANIIEIGRAHV